jgi:hypothetical protein
MISSWTRLLAGSLLRPPQRSLLRCLPTMSDPAIGGRKLRRSPRHKPAMVTTLTSPICRCLCPARAMHFRSWICDHPPVRRHLQGAAPALWMRFTDFRVCIRVATRFSACCCSHLKSGLRQCNGRLAVAILLQLPRQWRLAQLLPELSSAFRPHVNCSALT